MDEFRIVPGADRLFVVELVEDYSGTCEPGICYGLRTTSFTTYNRRGLAEEEATKFREMWPENTYRVREVKSIVITLKD